MPIPIKTAEKKPQAAGKTAAKKAPVAGKTAAKKSSIAGKTAAKKAPVIAKAAAKKAPVAGKTASKTARKTTRLGFVVVSSPLRQLPVRLTDSAVKKTVRDVVTSATSSPKSAKDYLVKLGTMTPKGNLTRKYGGK